MALSGAFVGTTGNQYIYPTIKWSAVQSQDGNYSDVTATLYYSRSNSGYTTSGTWSGGITIDGQWVAGSRHIEVSYQSGTLAMSATVRVYHDADGSRSVTISAAGYIGGTTLSSTDISQTVTLDQIARASVPTTNKSSIAMGEEIIIYTNRKNTAFCHTARYTFGGAAGDIADFDGETAWNWYSLVPKKSLANRIPNAASGTCTVYIKTWSDGNLTQQIGEEQSVSFTLTVPADAKPVVSTGWAAAAADNSGTPAAALTGFISGLSRAQVTFSAAKIALQYGASIKSYEVSCGGVKATASPYKTGVLSGGSAKITCKVTDSRGLTASEVLEVSLYEYAPPTLTGAKLYRSDDAMLPADTGLHIAGVAMAKFSACGGENVCTIKGYWRAVGGSWSAGVALTSGTAGLVTGDVDILTTASYEAKIEITDKLGNTASFSAVIPTADVAFHLRPGGKGAAFGKYSEKEALECAWPAEFRDVLSVARHIYMGGQKENDAEKDIHFQTTPSAANQHDAQIYGGSGTSETAIGIYDALAKAVVLAYKDGSKVLELGSAAVALKLMGSSLADFVIEQGVSVSGLWTWRKWYSGIAECWGQYKETGVAIDQVWGSVYDSEVTGHLAYPSGLFTDIPVLNLNVMSAPSGDVMSLEIGADGGNTHTPYWYYIRPSASTGLTVTTALYARGHWK